VNKRRTGTP